MLKGLFRSVAGLGFASMIACSSSSGGSGAGSGGCGTLCTHLQRGENCADLDVGQCITDCQATIAECPQRADALVSCISTLPVTCTGVGQAVGGPVGAAAPSSVYVSAGSAVMEIQDAACAQAATAFNECTPVGTGGSSGSSGSGGSGAGGSGGVGGSSGSSGGSAGAGGSGGGNDCPASHPYHCAASDTCWEKEADCSTVTQCGNQTVACSPAQSAQNWVVDCAHAACVATPASCVDPDYPTFCPAKGGAYPGCFTPNAACSTLVYCEGVGARTCSQANQAVDCAAQQCLSPKVAEASDATCSNGIDDDGNGFIDCKDFHCLANASITVCSGETDDISCSNGLDDDGNGFEDCLDFSCQISPAVTKCAAEKGELQCHDGADNDGDGKLDCADTSCFGSAFTACP